MGGNKKKEAVFPSRKQKVKKVQMYFVNLQINTEYKWHYFQQIYDCLLQIVSFLLCEEFKQQEHCS